jgi:hypothetical protein
MKRSIKNKLSYVNLALLLVWAISSIACGPKSGGNASNSPGNTATTLNKRDHKIVCNYLPDFTIGEFRLAGSYYSCINEKKERLASGQHRDYSYGAYALADEQNSELNITYVSINTMIDTKFPDAAGEDDRLVKLGDDLWQKVFATPLPNDIKEALLTNKGKAVAFEKKFTTPTDATVSRSVYSPSDYNLTLKFNLPK